MTSMSSGGCFCKSCMKQFSAWLRECRAEGKLGPEWDGIDLNTFLYGEYLKEHGCTYPENAPFYRDYWEFQVRQVRKYFGELADFARSYGAEKYGRRIEVSGNFYNMQPAYYPIENKVDLVITEMDHTLFRQPDYYRYCAGFASDKPVIIAENPYGGIIPRLLEMLDRGKGYDLYRIFLLEASMYGCNMSVPYGGWMGNTIQDSFWAPRALTAEVQDFLLAHEDCYPRTRSRGAAVLYSYGSNYWRDSTKGSGIYRTAFTIILPMMVPALITAAIFVFLQVWNELLLASLLTTSDVRTLTVGIRQMSGQYQTDYGSMGAGLVIATLPTLILYMCMSSQVQKSLVAGAVKG